MQEYTLSLLWARVTGAVARSQVDQPVLPEKQEPNMNPEVEEALEAIYVFEEEGRAPVITESLSSVLKAAIDQGLALRRGADYGLTPRGREVGREILRRHRLSECLLKDVIADSAEHVHQDACNLEHLLEHGLTERVCQLLDHPRKCPDGRPIPEGDCCRRAREEGVREVRPLCDGLPGQSGAVAYLAASDPGNVRKLLAMGVLPGVGIKVVQSFPAYVFQLGFSQFAVDRTMAEMIHVRWDSAKQVRAPNPDITPSS
jgi:DtxR family Mn-dependent transcriptional regulator